MNKEMRMTVRHGCVHSGLHQELISYVSSHSALDDKSVDLVAQRFGFCDHPTPTSASVAAGAGMHADSSKKSSWDAPANHGAIEDLLIKALGVSPHVKSLPSAIRASEILGEKPIWEERAYLARLRKEGIVGDIGGAFGLLELLNRLGLGRKYFHVKDDLHLTRHDTSSATADGFRFLMKDAKKNSLGKVYRRLSMALSHRGLRSIKHLSQQYPEVDFEELRPVLIPEGAWSTPHEGDVWFWRPRSNRGAKEPIIYGVLSRVRQVAPRVPQDVLVEHVKRQWDQKRIGIEPELPAAVLRNYLKAEGLYQVEGEEAVIAVPTTPLCVVDAVFAKHLRGEGKVTAQILHALVGTDLAEAKGSSSPKTVEECEALAHASDVVLVRKVQGTGSDRFCLIGDEISNPSTKKTEDRRSKLLMLLKSLQQTDRDERRKARIEHRILRELLFLGKAEESCACCGRSFGVSALVAAHKKKRVICTTSERIDPDIVFPLCTFGCDYLYEKRLLRVQNGQWRAAISAPGPTEQAILGQLDGRSLEERWRSPASYFEEEV